MRFLTPCLHPGCPELTTSGRCDKHGRPKTYAPKQASKGATYDHRWAKVRSAHRKREPLCRRCEKSGRVRHVEEVDHIVPFRGSGYLMLADWNLQSLCRSCHARKSANEGKWADLVYPMPDRKPDQLVVITGAPGVGKTTHAKTYAAQGWTVLDLDSIAVGLGVHGRNRTPEAVAAALAVRNQRLRSGGRIAMIVTAPERAARMFWRTVWGAEVVTLELNEAELAERIERDAVHGSATDRAEASRAFWARWEPDQPGDGAYRPTESA
jgi:5-methylcytosine-specific restriction enzyme A